MALIDPKHNYLVIPEEVLLETYAEDIEAVTAALDAVDEGLLPRRVILIIREIDLSEWERCPSCGKVVEKGMWCWSSMTCLEKRNTTTDPPCD